MKQLQNWSVSNRHIDQVENEKFNATTDLSTKLARTEEILMEYREKVNITEEKAQKLTENHRKTRQQFELVVEHLRGEIQSLKELLVKQNDEHNLALTKSTKPSPTKVRISVWFRYYKIPFILALKLPWNVSKVGTLFVKYHFDHSFLKWILCFIGIR